MFKVAMTTAMKKDGNGHYFTKGYFKSAFSVLFYLNDQCFGQCRLEKLTNSSMDKKISVTLSVEIRAI